MERTIKFRGKSISGDWVYGYFFKSWDNCYILHGTVNGAPTMVEIIPETVGQFTGLKDKNGVEIYEGDIILFTWFRYGEYELEHEYKGTVEFINGSFMFCCEHGNYPFSELNFDSKSDIEIIGNILDYPEMLELWK